MQGAASRVSEWVVISWLGMSYPHSAQQTLPNLLARGPGWPWLLHWPPSLHMFLHQPKLQSITENIRAARLTIWIHISWSWSLPGRFPLLSSRSRSETQSLSQISGHVTHVLQTRLVQSSVTTQRHRPDWISPTSFDSFYLTPRRPQVP